MKNRNEQPSAKQKANQNMQNRSEQNMKNKAENRVVFKQTKTSPLGQLAKFNLSKYIEEKIRFCYNLIE